MSNTVERLRRVVRLIGRWELGGLKSVDGALSPAIERGDGRFAVVIHPYLCTKMSRGSTG